MKLTEWHGLTFAGQEYKYDVKTSVISLVNDTPKLNKVTVTKKK